MRKPSAAAPGLIAGSAKAARRVAPTTAELADRIAKMESALEQLGQSSKYHTELAEYVVDLRSEVASIKEARKWVGSLAVIAAFVLFAAPIWVSAHQYKWFVALPPYVAAALLISMAGSGVVLLTAIAKSVFRSASERHSDEFIPPQLKLIHEMTKGGSK